MILDTLRWFSRLDRSYFFAISALISALIVSAALAFAPIARRVDGSDVSLLERDGAIVLVLLILPVLVLGTPLISLPQRPGARERSHKINATAATVVLIAFVGVSFPSFGLFYVPALIFSMASSVSLFFGRDRRGRDREASSTAGAAGGGDEARLGRGARKRLTGQDAQRSGDATGANGAATPKPGEAPLVSSRRRRGRNRRKR